MNTEQERADFKKYYGTLFDLTEIQDGWGNPRFVHEMVEAIWYGWRGGRTVRRLQVLEDAERYRAWRKATASNNSDFLQRLSDKVPDWDEGPMDESKIDEAIDHARRSEGEDK